LPLDAEGFVVVLEEVLEAVVEDADALGDTLLLPFLPFFPKLPLVAWPALAVAAIIALTALGLAGTADLTLA